MSQKSDRGLFDLSPEVKEALIARVRDRAPVPLEPDEAPPTVPQEFTRLDTLPGARTLQLQRAAARTLEVEDPFFRVHEGRAGCSTRIGGREFVNFASYDYLGLNSDPRVGRAAQAAVEEFGTSAAASRLIGGERPVHGLLEDALAHFLGVEASVCFVSGVIANTTTIGSLFGPRDLVAHDARIHSSVLQGIRMSGAERLPFPHNDWEALDRTLQERRAGVERVLVVVEGLYSMDGDIPDLPRFVEVKRRHGAFLMVDEAHSIGVLGDTGRGIREHFGMDPADVDLWMGTLSKTLSGCGGYIAGDRSVVQLLRHTAPGFVFSVGMSPVLAAASLEALRILEAEPERVRTLRERSRFFVREARDKGVDVANCAGFAVIPVILGDSLKTVRIAARLMERGIHVPPAIPPGVEPSRARLRFFLNAGHTEEQISAAVRAVAEELERSETG